MIHWSQVVKCNVQELKEYTSASKKQFNFTNVNGPIILDFIVAAAGRGQVIILMDHVMDDIISVTFSVHQDHFFPGWNPQRWYARWPPSFEPSAHRHLKSYYLRQKVKPQ